MFTKAFWKDVLERAIKSAAQGMLALFTLDATGVITINVSWQVMLAAAGYGALYSVLTSIVSAPLGSANSASLIKMILAFVMLSSAAAGAEIVGPNPPPATNPNPSELRVKQGNPPLVRLRIQEDDGQPLPADVVVKWTGPIGEGQIAEQCHDGLLTSTAVVGRHEFMAVKVPKTVTGPDDVEILKFTLIVDGVGTPPPPPPDDPPPPPPGIVTDLSGPARQWLANVPSGARGPKSDVAKAIREIVNANPPLGITEMELFLGISLPFALGDQLPSWASFNASANAALNSLKAAGATADQYRTALKSIAGALEQ